MKKILLGILLIISLLIISGCKSDKKENKTMKVVIDNKEYRVILEDNETVDELLHLLPKSYVMKDLNNNEKYTYMEESLKINPVNPKKINKGDIMLFGDNCLVIFYKSFITTYSYTKIGHIDNLEDLGEGNINVKLIKN